MARKVAPPSWPADAVERWPIGKLLPYANNARMHSEQQIKQLAALISEYGWTIPILVNEQGEIIAGHGRVQAAGLLNIDSIPTMVAKGWSKAKVKAYRLIDNRMNELSAWDNRMLGLELASLRDLGVNLNNTGWTAAQIEQLAAPELDPEKEWAGMPEYEQGGSEKPFRSIVVHFMDQGAVEQFARLLGQTFTDKTRFTWFPQVERADFTKHRYAEAAG